MHRRPDLNSEGAEKRRWCFRILLTLLLLALIAIMVLTAALYRLSKSVTYYEQETGEDAFNDQSVKEIVAAEIGERSNVVSGHQICESIGNEILGDNGSAVDAAVAMLFCQGVVEPHRSGLGGGFVMLIFVNESKEVMSLGAKEVAPKMASSYMFDTHSANLTGVNKRQGWLTVAVPGEPKGLSAAHQKYGKLPWGRLIEPSIRLSLFGFTISHHLAQILVSYNDTVFKDSELRKLFVNPITNKLLEEGDEVVNADYGELLMNIAANGVDYLYRGNADAFLGEAMEGGGVITAEDLEEYEVEWSQPLKYTFNAHGRFYTLNMPPPPSSAIMIGMILNIMQEYNEKDYINDRYSSIKEARFYHKLIEAMKHTFGRRHLFGDSANSSFADFNFLLNPQFGVLVRSLIDSAATFPPSHYTKSLVQVQDDGTANVGVVAPNGDVAVASSTLNDPFGAGFVSKSLKFILNNNLLTFSSPFNTSTARVDSGNLINPGKRPLTSLSPLIVLDSNDNFQMLIAGSGGVKIPTSIALFLIRYFWLKEDVLQALSRFRFHHQLYPDYVEYEASSDQTLSAMEFLKGYGHKVLHHKNRWPSLSVIIKKNHQLLTVLDPRIAT